MSFSKYHFHRFVLFSSFPFSSLIAHPHLVYMFTCIYLPAIFIVSQCSYERIFPLLKSSFCDCFLPQKQICTFEFLHHTPCISFSTFCVSMIYKCLILKDIEIVFSSSEKSGLELINATIFIFNNWISGSSVADLLDLVSNLILQTTV